MILTLRHSLFLAIRHLLDGPVRTIVLLLGTTVALFLPIFTYLAAGMIEERLLQRAETTPILVGQKGNEFDLTISSLYFRGHVRDPVLAGTREELETRSYGLVVPLYVKHTAGGVPIVGTSLEYFKARGLRLASGRLPGLLGEIVAGGRVADEFHLELGDNIRSDLTNLYNIAGSYPKLLRVVGILEDNGSSDDEVFFTDVKMVWLLDGALHGHQDVTRDLALNPQAQEGENLEATAALFIFAEINDENRSSFHLHGDEKEMPLSALLVYPKNQKAYDQLLGDYALSETLQAVEPVQVVRTILGIVLRVREGLGVYFTLVAFSTAAFFALVLTLTLRLRRAEITLMQRIGCSRLAIPTIVGTEIVLVLFAAACLTASFTALGLAIIESRLG